MNRTIKAFVFGLFLIPCGLWAVSQVQISQKSDEIDLLRRKMQFLEDKDVYRDKTYRDSMALMIARAALQDEFNKKALKYMRSVEEKVNAK